MSISHLCVKSGGVLFVAEIPHKKKSWKTRKTYRFLNKSNQARIKSCRLILSVFYFKSCQCFFIFPKLIAIQQFSFPHNRSTSVYLGFSEIFFVPLSFQNTSLLMVLKPPPPPPPPDGPQLPGGLLSSEPLGLNEHEDEEAWRAWVRALSSCSWWLRGVDNRNDKYTILYYYYMTFKCMKIKVINKINSFG